MAGNEVFRDGDRVSLPVPSGKKSGDPVRVGAGLRPRAHRNPASGLAHNCRHDSGFPTWR